MNTNKQHILVIGANGSTGRIICDQLKVSSEYYPIAMIRDEDQQKRFKEKGIETVVGDLEKDFENAFDNIDRVIFAAGSGGSTGPEKTEAVDKDGAKKSVDFAKKHHVKKFVMLSSMGTGDPEDFKDSQLYPYLVAKQKADTHLMESGLHYTIVRPGGLTDDKGTGKIEAAPSLGKRGKISREDVAKTIIYVLGSEVAPNSYFEIIEGADSIKGAVDEFKKSST